MFRVRAAGGGGGESLGFRVRAAGGGGGEGLGYSFRAAGGGGGEGGHGASSLPTWAPERSSAPPAATPATRRTPPPPRPIPRGSAADVPLPPSAPPPLTPSWHLWEHHVLVDGAAVPGAIFDFALFFFHNAKELLERGSGPYFYLPKMQSHLECRLWNEIFVDAQVGPRSVAGWVECVGECGWVGRMCERVWLGGWAASGARAWAHSWGRQLCCRTHWCSTLGLYSPYRPTEGLPASRAAHAPPPLPQAALGIPRGTIKATCLIETLPAAFEMDEFIYELREHSAGGWVHPSFHRSLASHRAGLGAVHHSPSRP